MNRRVFIVGVLSAVVLLGLPAVGSNYALSLGSRILIFAILALSLDLILGYGGLVSFGHAAFYGVGAYITGALAFYNVANGFAHVALAIGGSAAVAFVVGLLSVRTRSIYFIMLTFAFAQMIFYFAIGQQQFGGDDGMSLKHRSDFGGFPNLADPIQFYYLAAAVLAGALIVCDRLVRSRFGIVLSGCMQNETRLRTLGFSAYWYKVVAFTIAGAIAGLSGVLAANLNAYVSPNFLDWRISGTIIMMLVIGGVGKLYGAPFGALVYVLLEEAISVYTAHWMAVFGPLLVLSALFWRRGLYGILVGASGRS
jgi:branched-chain amino acid transport system permease protein